MAKSNVFPSIVYASCTIFVKLVDYLCCRINYGRKVVCSDGNLSKVAKYALYTEIYRLGGNTMK